MELKLNVYEKTKIVKTYTTNDFVLTTGLCCDILEMVDIDKLTGGKLNEESLGIEILKIVSKAFKQFCPFIIDIFDGMTEAEYRQTDVAEVATVIFNVVKHTISSLYSVGGSNQKK